MCSWSWLCWFTFSFRLVKKRKVVAFDINKNRVNELNKNFDVNNKSLEVFKSNKNIKFISV